MRILSLITFAIILSCLSTLALAQTAPSDTFLLGAIWIDDNPSTTLAGLGEPNTMTSVTPLPDAFSVKAAYPNPFNPATMLSFSLPEVAKVTLNVFDVQGRLVATLVNGLREAGQHQVTFDGSNLSSGVYLYTLQAGSYSATGKMVLMK